MLKFFKQTKSLFVKSNKAWNYITIVLGSFLLGAWVFFSNLKNIEKVMFILNVLFISFGFVLLWEKIKDSFIFDDTKIGHLGRWLKTRIEKAEDLRVKYWSKGLNREQILSFGCELSVWRKKIFIVFTKLNINPGPFKDPDILASEAKEEVLHHHLFEDVWYLQWIKRDVDSRTITIDESLNVQIFDEYK